MKKNIPIVYLLFIMASVFVTCTSPKEKGHDSIQEQTASPTGEEKPENQITEQDTIKGSIPSEAVGRIGPANIKINYYAPGVKGRILWGGLVPYDQVWVTGAHMATNMEIDSDLTIGEQRIPAGKYALFTIPGRNEWTIIINKNWKQHLADDYDQKDDILRFDVKPSVLDQHQERLKYEVLPISETEGKINISWDKLTIALPVNTKL